MYQFLMNKDEWQLAVISKKVLNRPQECLSLLKRQLDERMIRDENDHRPRVWQPKSSAWKLYFPAMKGSDTAGLDPSVASQ